MAHLEIDEIIEFVSFTKINDETMALVKKVNEHILSCKVCREKVEAAQLVYDELCRIGNFSDLKKSIYRVIDEVSFEKMQKEEIEALIGDSMQIDVK